MFSQDPGDQVIGLESLALLLGLLLRGHAHAADAALSFADAQRPPIDARAVLVEQDSAQGAHERGQAAAEGAGAEGDDSRHVRGGEEKSLARERLHVADGQLWNFPKAGPPEEGH